MLKRMRIANVLAVCWAAVLVLSAGPAFAQAKAAASELSEVTLYRDQAQITRVVAVPKGDGPVELVVTGLPSQILSASLFAEGGEAIDVRAVRYRERVVGVEPRDDIRALDEQIDEKQIEIGALDERMWLVKKRFEYLEKLDSFTAATGTNELSSGVLDAKQLRETTEFIFAQRDSATTQKLELEAKQRTAKRALVTLQQKRAQLAGKSQTLVREAVLFLDRRDANADAVRLTYLVNNCGWSPSYNVRGKLSTGKVRVEYNALIRQMTGEDWDKVKLTLSTASPMISASGPAIAAFPVSMRQLAQGGRAVNPPAAFSPQEGQFGKQHAAQVQLQTDFDQLQVEQTRNNILLNNNSRYDDNVEIAWSGNLIANRFQLLELCEPVDELMPIVMVQSPDQGLSISYVIDGAVSLQSRSDQQMTRIMQSELDGDFYHVANPVLTPFVYREAAVLNTSGRDLLAGPVSVYLDGRFVGRTDMVSVTRGQTFVLGFGADPQLTASRKLVERDQKQQGGNTRLAFEYRLAVENFGSEAAAVRLYDRLPHFNGKDDVKLTLESGFDDLSTDAVYLREERPEGILRWDITVEPGATGEGAALTPYRYTLEFDRKFGLASEVDARLKEQFKKDVFRGRKY